MRYTLSRRVNQFNSRNRRREGCCIPKRRCISILVSYLDTVTVVTELDPFKTNAANCSSCGCVALGSKTKRINCQFNLRGCAGSCRTRACVTAACISATCVIIVTCVAATCITAAGIVIATCVATCGTTVTATENTVASLTGGSYHIVGNFFAKEKPSQFGIVNKNVSCTCNCLYGVISTHFPCVNGVFFHPKKENVKVFHNTAGTPHFGCVAPTNVNVKTNSCYVTAEVIFST